MDFLELPASLTELCGGYDHNEVILRATKTKQKTCSGVVETGVPPRLPRAIIA